MHYPKPHPLTSNASSSVRASLTQCTIRQISFFERGCHDNSNCARACALRLFTRTIFGQNSCFARVFSVRLMTTAEHAHADSFGRFANAITTRNDTRRWNKTLVMCQRACKWWWHWKWRAKAEEPVQEEEKEMGGIHWSPLRKFLFFYFFFHSPLSFAILERCMFIESIDEWKNNRRDIARRSKRCCAGRWAEKEPGWWSDVPS